MGCVYSATNLINKKVYIGHTGRTLKIRQREHENYTPKDIFHYALRKYGKENFQWEILYEIEDETLRKNIERWLIIELNTQVPNGYNLTEGGEGGKLHKDTKIKIGRFHKEYQNRPEVIARNRKQTKKQWEDLEWKEKTSKAIRKALNRPEIKAKMKEFQNRSEVKAAISKFHKEYKNRPEVKAATSKFQKECQNRPEQKESRSKFQKEHQNLPEVKANNSKFHKEFQNRPEVKENKKKAQIEFQNRPKVKENKSKFQKEFQNRPEVKENKSKKQKEIWAKRTAEERFALGKKQRAARRANAVKKKKLEENDD